MFISIDEYEGDDSSNSKSFRSYQNNEKKISFNKDTTDNDIMVILWLEVRKMDKN